MADPAHPVSTQVSSVSFSFLTSQDVKSISVKQITNPTLFDTLGNPTLGGLYDPALGPSKRGDICATCSLQSFDCPGHYGHIDLPTPVFHPLFLTQTYNLLRGSCFVCHRFLMPAAGVAQYKARMILLERGLVTDSDDLASVNIQAVKPLAKAKAAREGQGDDTGESLVEYEERLWKHITNAVKKAKRAGINCDRDSYKSAICFDKRKDLIHEFLKSTIRKKCSNCQAHHHRMRKEGHTKIMEYSLTAKQTAQDEVAGVKREHILMVQAAAAKEKQRKSQASDTATAKQLRHDSDEEASQGYNADEVDSDADSDEPEAPNGRAASPASSSSSEASSVPEATEDNGLDDSEEEELEADLATVSNQEPQPAQQTRLRQTERMVQPDECRQHLRLLFDNEPEICALIYGGHGPLASRRLTEAARLARIKGKGRSSSSVTTQFGNASADMFFLDTLAVPPSRFRPAASMGDMQFENPQSEMLGGVLKSTLLIRDRLALYRQATAKKPPTINGETNLTSKAVLAGGQDRIRLYGLLLEAIIGLQIAVNSLFDSSKNPTIVRQGKEPPQGIKQILEKKEGLFRKNMMGKRVNYAARSVISPDINIETNEIGVPPVFAKKLTFPEPVTPHNVRRMMQLVINGTKIHPGAAYIQMEDGSMVSLDRMSDEERHAKAQQLLTPSSRIDMGGYDRPDVGLPNTKTPQVNRKVFRHLDDGDILILNRQPTLHKPSMMCHRAKILRGEKTIRMHYANCNSYNADFDGDEMNMHFPQSYIAQAEARLIANTDNQYLVPTSGNPLRGLIQDHVVAGTWMTSKDTFFSREEYYQLIYGALRPEDGYSGQGRVITVDPAIWKPQAVWTGKQVITTILMNITPLGAKGLNMASGSKVPADAWGPANKEEGTVQFVNGHMITGTLDKSQFGATSYGLVHSCYELYGADVAGKLLGMLSRLFTKYLQHRAFSCRMDDLILTKQGNSVRTKHVKTAEDRGYMAALKVVQLDKEEDIHSAETKENLKVRLESILRDDMKLAGLDAVVTSVVGELTSQTIKDCLPSGLVKPFPHNNMQTMTISGAKGSNVNASQISCMLGQQSLEGRRVPTMVSGKTLPSFRAFDTAPRAGGYVAQRFLTGIRPQEYYFHCMAGREGLIDTAVKTSRSGYLQRCLIKHLEGIKVNYDYTVRNADQSVIQFHYGEDGLDVTKQKTLMQFEFATRNMNAYVQRYSLADLAGRMDEVEAQEHMRKTLKQCTKQVLAEEPRSVEVADPTLSLYSPARHIGSVSERYAVSLSDYMTSNPQKLIKSKKKDRKLWHEWELKRNGELLDPNAYTTVMNVRYMRSLVDPGEAVGLLASQGVGEPSTQMTLNTFHFAGHGAANVTLGIPRLREIVMTASANIKTPTMRMEVAAGVSQEDVETLCKMASKVTLSQVVEEVTVNERLSTKDSDNAYSRDKLYTVKMKFFPREEYEEEFRTTPEQILRCIQRTFTPAFDKEVAKGLKNSMKGARLSEIGKGQKERSSNQRTETGDDIEAGDGQGAVEDEMALPKSTAEEVDNDADDARRAKQGQDEADYDESDDEQEANGLPMDTEALDAFFAADEGEENAADAISDVESDDIDGESAEATSRKTSRLEEKERVERLERIQEFIAGHSKFFTAVRFDKSAAGAWCELDLKFGAKQPKLLLVGIIEACCRVAVVHQAPLINRCFVANREKSAKPSDPDIVVTEGVNLAGAWSFAQGVINMDTIYSNDIAAFLRTYGVEAARSVLIKEIQGVFSVYGIGVDRRHLTLIADYMTSEGGYKPFNRTGLANSPSPFLKASFETTATFVADAALYGDYEDLTSPSASIVMGKSAYTGTGVFEVCSSLRGQT